LRNRRAKGLGDGIDRYSRAAFLEDLIREADLDIRRCPQRGVDSLQIDFTEALADGAVPG
jgi:hypothetical protein